MWIKLLNDLQLRSLEPGSEIKYFPGNHNPNATFEVDGGELYILNKLEPDLVVLSISTEHNGNPGSLLKAVEPHELFTGDWWIEE